MVEKNTFYLEVYGCQMNVYDSKRITHALELEGFFEVDSPRDAEIIIFYTCNIREKAAKKLYSDIGRYRNEDTKVIAVGGCVAQSEKDDMFRKSKYIDIVFGPQTYHNLPSHIKKILSGEERRIIDIDVDNTDKFKFLDDHTKQKTNFSEFVAIQEGCDNFCTYCVVPYTRGRESSRPALDILNEVKYLVSNGTTEITLIGQNVNSYHGEAAYINLGQSRGTWSLERLIHEVSNIDGIRRLRYTTSHPKDFTEELMRAHRDIDILVPFVHIPVQSGSDRILKLMNRGHTSKEYLSKLERFREICPDISFSSDFIVGFPHETDEDFMETVDLARKARYSLFYAFMYSKRKNTPAYNMDDQIPDDIKSKRLAILQDVLLKDQLSFNKSCVGKKMEVLFERYGKKENQYIGKSVYFQSVVVESSDNLIGEFRDIHIEDAFQNSLSGRIV